MDEIAEIPFSIQAKLLHVTQEKTFTRLGSNKPRNIDVRIISATNQDLKRMVQEGKFREDLYYRLNILDIRIPALRERKEDIPVLVEAFLEKHRQKGKKQFRISDQLMGVMINYPWPGNVRELQNAVERAVVLCQNEELSIDDFPTGIKNSIIPAKPDTPALALPDDKSLPDLMDETEKKLILYALAQSHGKAADAAKKLGISRQNLLYKLNKYGIKQ